MRCNISVLTILFAGACFLDSEIAAAASGDTAIHVHYAAKSVRVRPQPNNGGSGTVDFEILLHPNGKVEDKFAVKDGLKGEFKSKLGNQSHKAVYRVIDASTIERTTDLGTHFHKLTIKVAGKNCTANVEYLLKPGQTEYRDYSTQLKKWAYYSKLEMDYATCVIE
jgi:hypothetical protein